MRALFIVRDLASAEPLGLMQLAALLQGAGHQVRLVGARATRLAPVMDAFAPDLVGYSACTGLHRYLIRLNRWLKSRWRFVSVFGGPHPTFFPEMIAEEGVDAVCRGEGDGAILDIAAAIEAGRPLDEIANLWVKTPDGAGSHSGYVVPPSGGVRSSAFRRSPGPPADPAPAGSSSGEEQGTPEGSIRTPPKGGTTYPDLGGGIRQNPLRPLVADLDSLPFPDRDVRHEGDPASRDYPVKSFLASRGCPFRCSYCFNVGYAALYGPEWCHVRTRSVGNVLAEIRTVRAASRLEFVQFRESIFPWQEDWLGEFTERYRAEIGLPFYCHVRADLLTERRVALLRRAGCVSVNMGIECGDEDYRREMLDRPMTDAQIIEACRLLKAHGIRILADNMLGLPGAGIETDWKTLRLNQQCGIDYPLAMLFQPYPGTELARRAVAAGHFDGSYDQIEYNYYFRSPLAFRSERERFETENLQKFFAILVEAPWLERLVRPLLSRRPNLTFLCLFRAWYIYGYTRRIVPHRLSLRELRELGRSLFGLYPPEANDECLEEDGPLAGARGDAPGGAHREPVHHGVRRKRGEEARA